MAVSRRGHPGAFAAATAVLLLVGLLPRIVFWHDWPANFDSDEALVGCEALRIRAGLLPLYLAGQSYMGTLQSAVAVPLLELFGLHPTALRLAPFLWLLPGFFVVRALDRRAASPISSGHGSWALALVWLLPPSVLFLTSVKARGGILEGVVLGLFACLLALPGEGKRPAPGRVFGAGLAAGLGAWTHDAVLLFMPALAAFLLRPLRTALLRAGLFLAGAAIGFAPLWLPLVAPYRTGPPGWLGTDWGAESLANVVRGAPARIVRIVGEVFHGGGELAAPLAIGSWFLILAFFAALVLLFAAEFGRRPDRLSASPLLSITGSVAILGGGALLVRPGFFDDSQWMRYTFPIAPFTLVAFAWALSRLPKRVFLVSATVYVGASFASYANALHYWAMDEPEVRLTLLAELEERGARHVRTDWTLAYPIRFLTGDRILASSLEPLRYPEEDSRVDFAEDQIRVLSVRGPAVARGQQHDPMDRIQIRERHRRAPQEVLTLWESLDPRRVLWPHVEPAPLGLPKRTLAQRLPSRRSLGMFDAIVWVPDRCLDVEERARIETALRALVEAGEFAEKAEWVGTVIYVRPAGIAPGTR